MRLLAVLIIATGLIVFTHNTGQAQQTAPKPHFSIKNVTEANIAQQVYDICNITRISPNITEEQCAYAQDVSNTEFLCEHANTSPDNHCWVEFK